MEFQTPGGFPYYSKGINGIVGHNELKTKSNVVYIDYKNNIYKTHLLMSYTDKCKT